MSGRITFFSVNLATAKTIALPPAIQQPTKPPTINLDNTNE